MFMYIYIYIYIDICMCILRRCLRNGCWYKFQLDRMKCLATHVVAVHSHHLSQSHFSSFHTLSYSMTSTLKNLLYINKYIYLYIFINNIF